MDTTKTFAPSATTAGSKLVAAIIGGNPGSTIKSQGSFAWDEIAAKLIWLSEAEIEEKRVLWIKVAEGRGIGIESWGAAVAVSPGIFENDQLLTYGYQGTEFIPLSSDEPEKLVARVIRRARKLEG